MSKRKAPHPAPKAESPPPQPAPEWHVFRPEREPATVELPTPPPWRDFRADAVRDGVAPITREVQPETDRRGKTFRLDEPELEVVNAAIHLRRPLLVTGQPGSGKSSLAYALAYRLRLGEVLRWSINSRSTLREGLYEYDAVARLRALNVASLRATALERRRWMAVRLPGQEGEPNATAEGIEESAGALAEDDGDRIGDYLRLGPLGTALLPTKRPRVLLIDEIDKSDIDLPNDLLHVFEEGRFLVDELSRLSQRAQQVQPFDRHAVDDMVTITDGLVRCLEFPIVVLTSNGERDLPPAFLRRCLRLDMPKATPAHLKKVVQSHLHQLQAKQRDDLIRHYLARNETGVVALDQLLNALYLLGDGKIPNPAERDRVMQILLRELESR